MDVLALQASSVPCERLFSGSKQAATDRHASLSNDRFEELQVMKFAWKVELKDLAAWNSLQTEEIHLVEFEEMLIDGEEEDKWLAEEAEDDDLDFYESMLQIFMG